ncbi:MAG: T9SS type A sorting domain-containing protein [Flavobacteriales bacterium]
MRKTLLFGLLLTAANAFGQAGANDPTFNPLDRALGAGQGADNKIESIALQPDGKFLIGGWFAKYNGTPSYTLARLNGNGYLDPSFVSGLDPMDAGGASLGVHAMALQPDGKILIGGGFSKYNGVPRKRIARINSDGSLDPTFNPGTGISSYFGIKAMVLQPDGKTVITGDFTSYNGTPRKNIARVNSDGSLDLGFDPGTGPNFNQYGPFAMALQSDGKILIAGEFTSYDGTPRKNIARINSDGSLDQGFDPGAGTDYGLRSLAIQSDGKILIGGGFTSYNNTPRQYVARINSDGSLDLGFNAQVNGTTMAVALQPDEKILAAGYFHAFGETPNYGLVRLNSDGSPDLDFQFKSGPLYGAEIVIQQNGKIVVAGEFVNSSDGGDIARFNSDGSLDPGFNQLMGANGPISSIALQPDGKFLIAGSFTTYNAVQRKGLARINKDGSLDPGFVPASGVNDLYLSLTIVLQPDGKVLVNRSTGPGSHNIQRLNSDGSLDPSFNLGINSPVHDIGTLALQSDGKILAGTGWQSGKIYRLNSNGSMDLTFNPGGISITGGVNARVESIVIQSDGKILVGGIFTAYNLTPRNNIVRINIDGSLDTGFDAGVALGGEYQSLKDIAVQPDGKIVIVGNFSTFNGAPLKAIARLQSTGTLDPTFTSPTSITGGYASITTLTLQSDGKILIGGSFTHYQGAWRRYIARLYNDGVVDLDFNPGSGLENQYGQGPAGVGALVIQSDGNILLGGDFISYDGNSRNNLARILTEQNITVTLSTDAFGAETTWELTEVDGSPVAAGGPYSDGTPTVITEQITVPVGCYKFELHDAGGNGIQGGGYVLTYGNGQRIIDANGDFGSLSTTGAKFCLPLGLVRLKSEYCDDMVHSASEPVRCSAAADAIGYQFWFFDPHGSYQYRSNSSGNQVGPNRIAQLPTDLELNVRVRALLSDSSYTEFGPACKLMITGPGMAPQELRSTIADAGSSMSIWPNPLAEELLQLNMKGLATDVATAEVKLLDALGRITLYTAVPVANGSVSSTIDLVDVSNGIYVVQVTVNGKVMTSRLSVNR